MTRAMTVAAAALSALCATTAQAQNGLSDDRVSLPDGPGSVGGVGENAEVNPNMGSSSFSVAGICSSTAQGPLAGTMPGRRAVAVDASTDDLRRVY